MRWADVVMRLTQPALAAIKLAWWRERLEEMDKGSVPAEPRLAAVARELLPKGNHRRRVGRARDGVGDVVGRMARESADRRAR